MGSVQDYRVNSVFPSKQRYSLQIFFMTTNVLERSLQYRYATRMKKNQKKSQMLMDDLPVFITVCHL